MTSMNPPKQEKEKPREPKEVVRTFQSAKGMHDVLPSDEPYWEKIESVAHSLASAYGFSRIEPPVLEFAELYNKTSGEESDVVQKEMYTLKTKGGDFPGASPGIYAGHRARVYAARPVAVSASRRSCLRWVRSSATSVRNWAAWRQFTQIDFETLGGVNDPIYDAEIIAIFWDLLNELKIKNSLVKINSIGCRICRPIYKKQLTTYYKNHESALCEDCQHRLKVNPLKLLDCKEPGCVALKEKAPNFLDKICVMCSAHFKSVLEYLDEVKYPLMSSITTWCAGWITIAARCLRCMRMVMRRRSARFPRADAMTTSWKRSVDT